LGVMTEGQTRPSLTARIIEETSAILVKLAPDRILVQGDTTTAFATALAAFYLKIPVGHVEAGLRTHDVTNPYPEEMNRKLIGSLADLHFAPTQRAADALRAEGIPQAQICLTGNTIVDALELLRGRQAAPSESVRAKVAAAQGRLILVTCHRRENLSAGLGHIMGALRDIAKARPDHKMLFPMHPNPKLRSQAMPLIEDVPNIEVCDPLAYSDLLYVMNAAALVITDSGGLQEEAPSFGAPVIVIRHTTERPEGIDAGFAKLVPPDRIAIATQALDWLGANQRARLLGRTNPYGDGNAAMRIVERLSQEP
jgi:UDP-N-acetylglucosamine 2-epimerase (non-hydrolysing)